MSRRSQYLFGVLAITPVWFVIAIWLTLMMAGAEDTMPVDIPVPLWLTVAFSVVFPMYYVLDLWGDKPPPGFSEHGYLSLGLLVLLVNCVLWALVLVFLFRFVSRLVATKK